MRGRILKTITATTLAGIMLVASSGCGQVNVIEQAEEKCGLQSDRGQKIEYVYSLDSFFTAADWKSFRTAFMGIPPSVVGAFGADAERTQVVGVQAHGGQAAKHG